MFDLGPVHDLLLPTSPSTGRALASLARRRTFERLKTLIADESSARSHASVRELGRAWAALLPGSPHAISDAIADPAIGSFLRRRPIEARFFDEGVRRMLAALRGDEKRSWSSAIVEGRLALHVGDTDLARCVGIEEGIGDEGLVSRLRVTLDLLRMLHPSLRADADRFAARIVVTEVEAPDLPRHCVGLGVIGPGASSDACLHALVASVVRGKVSALMGEELGDHDEAAIRALISEAASRCTARLARAARDRGHLSRDDARFARLAEPVALTVRRSSLPSLLMPVYDECTRIA